MQKLVGCLLIHGFTGSPIEVEPLALHLQERGIETVSPTLAGHGEDPVLSMKEVNWQDWVRSAEVAMQEIQGKCDTVYVVGFSMGGLIAAYLANRYPVTKLVLLSASVFYLNPKLWAKDFAELVQAIFRDKQQLQEYRRYRERIKATPIRAVVQFRHLVRALKPELANINIPTLIIQGACDTLVDPRSAQYIYDNILCQDKHLHVLPKSKHIVCHDCEQDKLIQLVEKFLLPKRSDESAR